MLILIHLLILWELAWVVGVNFLQGCEFYSFCDLVIGLRRSMCKNFLTSRISWRLSRKKWSGELGSISFTRTDKFLWLKPEMLQYVLQICGDTFLCFFSISNWRTHSTLELTLILSIWSHFSDRVEDTEASPSFYIGSWFPYHCVQNWPSCSGNTRAITASIC